MTEEKMNVSYCKVDMSKSNALHVLATFFVLGALGFGIYQTIHSSLFSLKEVVVEPLSDAYPLTKEQVLGLARVPVGKYNLFDINLKPIEQRLLVHPWVKGVVLGKQFPNSLSLKILERKPVALLTEEKGRVLYLEDDGASFEDVSMVYPKDLPIITGFLSTDLYHLKQVNDFISVFFLSHKIPNLKLSSVSYDEKLGLKAIVLYPLKNKQTMRAVLELGINIEEASIIPQDRLKKVLEYLAGRSMVASKIWLGDGKKIVVKISRGS